MKSNLQAYLINEYQEEEVSKSGPRGKTLTHDEAFEIIDTKCRNTWEKFEFQTSWMSRITYSGRDDFSFMDTTSMPARMSKNTENYYTQIINKDPSWSKFPRRQVIATAGYRGHSAGNNIYTIFPYDGTNIGICPSTDIWVSFKLLGDNAKYVHASNFNTFISVMLNSIGKSIVPKVLKKYDKSLAQFKTKCKEFDKWYNAVDEKDKITQKITKGLNREMLVTALEFADMAWFLDNIYPKSSNNLYKALVKVFSPNGFKTGKSGSVNLPVQKGSEVWFDGAAVLVDSVLAQSIASE